MINRLILPAVLSACLTLLSACSSSGNSSSTSSGSSDKTLAERTGKWDMSKRSGFERTAKTVKTDKQFRTGSNYRTTSYKGKTQYNSGKKEIKEKSFSQANKKNRSQNESFSGANDRFSQRDTTFKTNQSRDDGRLSRDDSRVSSYSGDTYRTFDNRMGTRAMQTSERPYIQEMGNAGYTEDQVKGILNKN